MDLFSLNEINLDNTQTYWWTKKISVKLRKNVDSIISGRHCFARYNNRADEPIHWSGHFSSNGISDPSAKALVRHCVDSAFKSTLTTYPNNEVPDTNY